jgi:pilus assembly protein Flp/PilA
LATREDGQGLVEYALILAGVSVVAVAILFTVGGKISSLFTQIAGDI